MSKVSSFCEGDSYFRALVGEQVIYRRKKRLDYDRRNRSRGYPLPYRSTARPLAPAR
jgi:hypothetical protein